MWLLFADMKYLFGAPAGLFDFVGFVDSVASELRVVRLFGFQSFQGLGSASFKEPPCIGILRVYVSGFYAHDNAVIW